MISSMKRKKCSTYRSLLTLLLLPLFKTSESTLFFLLFLGFLPPLSSLFLFFLFFLVTMSSFDLLCFRKVFSTETLGPVDFSTKLLERSLCLFLSFPEISFDFFLVFSGVLSESRLTWSDSVWEFGVDVSKF